MIGENLGAFLSQAQDYDSVVIWQVTLKSIWSVRVFKRFDQHFVCVCVCDGCMMCMGVDLGCGFFVPD